MSYSIVYKCSLCGEILRAGKPVNVPYNQLPELCGRIVRNQQFMNNPALYQAPMQIPHKCRDGSCGMAYFAGFKAE